MSLQTDIIFVKALRSEETLMERLAAGDVYNTTIALPDEDADNAPLPYIIVTFDGMNNQDWTKDDTQDGETDRVQIGIEIAAETRPQLAELAIAVRQTVGRYFEDNADDALTPSQYELQAQGVQYDSLKPCYWQQLIYHCETNPD